MSAAAVIYRDSGDDIGAPRWYLRQLLERAAVLLTEGEHTPGHAVRLARWAAIWAEVSDRG